MGLITWMQAGYLFLILLAFALAYAGNVAQADTTSPNTWHFFEILLIFDFLAILLSTLYYIFDYGKKLLVVLSHGRI